MINKENITFLNQKFGIDCSKYSEDELSQILDKLICELDDAIFEKERNNLELLKTIVFELKD